MPDFVSERQTLKSQTPDITVYPHRRKTLIWIFLGAISSLLCFLFAIFILLLLIFAYHFHNTEAIFTAILMAGFGILGIWPTHIIASLLSSREPMLGITHEGIRIGKLFGSSEIVLPWEEIEAISLLVGGIEKQLSIRPTHIVSFLSRFNSPMNWCLRMNLLFYGVPIVIPQSFLATPIVEILDQLETLYAQELHHHYIDLHF